MPVLNLFLNDPAYALATYTSGWYNFDSIMYYTVSIYCSGSSAQLEIESAVDSDHQVIKTEVIDIEDGVLETVTRGIEVSFVRFKLIGMTPPVDLKIQGYFFTTSKPPPSGDNAYSGGWASYTDSRTNLNPEVIGTSPTLYENDASSGPRAFSRGKAIWDSSLNRMIGVSGRAYNLRFNFIADPQGAASYLTIIFDISGSLTTPTNVISQRAVSFLKGSGPNVYSVTTAIFALNAFELNGMRIFLVTDGGTVEVYESNLLIQCVYDDYRF